MDRNTIRRRSNRKGFRVPVSRRLRRATMLVFVLQEAADRRRWRSTGVGISKFLSGRHQPPSNVHSWRARRGEIRATGLRREHRFLWPSHSLSISRSMTNTLRGSRLITSFGRAVTEGSRRYAKENQTRRYDSEFFFFNHGKFTPTNTRPTVRRNLSTKIKWI